MSQAFNSKNLSGLGPVKLGEGDDQSAGRIGPLPLVLMLVVISLLGALMARDQIARRREADIERRLNNVLLGYNQQRGTVREIFSYRREVQRLNVELASLRGELKTVIGQEVETKSEATAAAEEQDQPADLPVYVPHRHRDMR